MVKDFPIGGTFSPKTDYVDQLPLNTEERKNLKRTTAQSLNSLQKELGGNYHTLKIKGKVKTFDSGYGLRVRDENGNKIGTIYKGEEVRILERKKGVVIENGQKKNFVKVDVYNERGGIDKSRSGWVAEDFIEIDSRSIDNQIQNLEKKVKKDTVVKPKEATEKNERAKSVVKPKEGTELDTQKGGIIKPKEMGGKSNGEGTVVKPKNAVDNAEKAEEKAEADKAAEEAKKKAEADKAAEEAKKKAEADKAAEEAKKKAEADKAAEEAKKKAEADKAAEEAKKKAEADKAAEEAKKKAEADKAAEEAKKKAEADKAAEEAKKKAEADKAAEEAKKKAEADKAAEEAKKTAEKREKQEKLLKYGGSFKALVPDDDINGIYKYINDLATNQYCTFEEIMDLNDTDLYFLSPGDILTIPIHKDVWNASNWYGEEGEVEAPEHIIEYNPLRQVKWNRYPAGKDAKKLANWIAKMYNGDTSLIFDKENARMYIMKDNEIVYSSAFLYGANDATDIMTQEAYNIDPDNNAPKKHKITPAGQFPVKMNTDDHKLGVNGVSFGYLSENEAEGTIHKPYLDTPSEKRLERLKSTTPDDNNVSYGCLNIPNEAVKEIEKYFQDGKTFAYVMPNMLPIEEYFPLDYVPKDQIIAHSDSN